MLLVFACPDDIFPTARIPGAIPSGEFQARIPSLRRDAVIILYCACAGDQAAHAMASDLIAAGFTKVGILRGGIFAWIHAGYELAPQLPSESPSLP